MALVDDLIKQLDGAWAQLRAEITKAVPTPTPAATTISTAADLVAAFAAGGTFDLISDTVYVGNFVASKPITLTGPRTAILTPKDLLAPTLQVNAKNVTLTGFTVKNGAPDRECVVVGSPTATTAAAQPDTVLLDSLLVEAGAQGGHRGIALHGSNLTLRNCRVLNFWEIGRDSQAVWIHNGPGPYTVENCYLEASGENILGGGASIKIPNCIPSDITIRGNTFFKPQAWRTNGAQVKNGVELKVGRRVLIENNTVDGCWKNAQTGTPIVLTVRNQEGDNPWVTLDEVTVRGNTVRNCPDGYAVNILGHDDGGAVSGQMQKMLFEHNLFVDSPGGFLIGNGVAADLTIRNNTFPGIKYTFLALWDELTPPRVVTPLTFTNNVLSQGEYGMNAGDYAYPFNQIVKFVAFTGNVIEKNAARQIAIPAGNTWVAVGGLKALLDPATYKLLSGSAGY